MGVLCCEKWKRGHLVEDDAVYDRDTMVLFAHTAQDQCEKDYALNDVMVVDVVDQAILCMMGVDIETN